MPINKVTDKNGKQKYRVRVNYTDNYGNNKQIERIAYGSDEAKQLEQELLYSVKQEQTCASITSKTIYYPPFISSCKSSSLPLTSI